MLIFVEYFEFGAFVYFANSISEVIDTYRICGKTISSSDVNTPSFEELTAGWTSNLNNMQKIMHTDVENYFKDGID
jgi:hypothetical protein